FHRHAARAEQGQGDRRDEGVARPGQVAKPGLRHQPARAPRGDAQARVWWTLGSVLGDVPDLRGARAAHHVRRQLSRSSTRDTADEIQPKRHSRRDTAEETQEDTMYAVITVGGRQNKS